MSVSVCVSVSVCRLILIFVFVPMNCFLAKCGTLNQVLRIREDGNNRKERKIERDDDIVIGEAPKTMKISRKGHRRVRSKERKMMPSSSRLQRSQIERVELGGWLAAWLEEAEGEREKDEVKELEKEIKR